MKEFSSDAIAGVAMGKKRYVPPQMEVVELERQTPLLAVSGAAGKYKADFEDLDRDDW
jgi:hypothetical protein